jgi:hypothetical protein
MLDSAFIARTERRFCLFTDAVACDGFYRGGPMPYFHTPVTLVPAIAPNNTPSMSDDECLMRLAEAIEDGDSDRLDEVARLIGRLAVTIE